MEDQEKEALSCKIVLIGESGVGKTSIISRYISNTFESQLMPTSGAKCFVKTLIMEDDNQAIKFEIWDTGGKEKFRSLAKVFYKNAAVCVLVYDVTRKSSFEELKQYWIKEIKDNTKPNISKKLNIKI